MVQYYRIAGLLVEMDTYGRAESQAKSYLTDEKGQPDMVISGYAQQLQQNQPHLTIDECEYISTGAVFYRQLLKFDGMLVHASAVVKDGFAYIFSAPSGTGKSTHTDLWRDTFGRDTVIMLNDDKPALRKENGRWYAYGTPWSGKTPQNENIRVPLGGVCMLYRGQTNTIKPFTGAKAAFALLEQTSRPPTAAMRGRLLELLDDLLEQVPVWQLHCTPTKEAAILSHNAMTAEANKRWPDNV